MADVYRYTPGKKYNVCWRELQEGLYDQFTVKRTAEFEELYRATSFADELFAKDNVRDIIVREHGWRIYTPGNNVEFALHELDDGAEEETIIDGPFVFIDALRAFLNYSWNNKDASIRYKIVAWDKAKPAECAGITPIELDELPF